MAKPKTAGFRAVIMDVDGTLARSDHDVSEWTCQTVARLAAAGLIGIVVTGRSERVALEIARACRLTAPVISAGGSMTTDPVTGARLRVECWAPDTVARAAKVAKRLGCHPLLWTADHIYAEAESVHNAAFLPQVGEVAKIVSFDDLIASEPIVKIMVVGSPALLDEAGPELAALIPECVRSMPNCYDGAPAGSSKLEAVSDVLHRLGFGLEDCIGFGDGDNDIEWMARLGHAVAVSNASAGVRAIAAEVAGHHDDDGVARYLDEILLAP